MFRRLHKMENSHFHCAYIRFFGVSTVGQDRQFALPLCIHSVFHCLQRLLAGLQQYVFIISARSMFMSIFCPSFLLGSAGNSFCAIWHHLGVSPSARCTKTSRFHCVFVMSLLYLGGSQDGQFEFSLCIYIVLL